MKSKGLEAFSYLKKDRNSEDEGSDGNTSQNKMHINASSKDSDPHAFKKGRSSKHSKKNSSSNGLQLLEESDMIGSRVQGDTSNLSDTSQSSAGLISQKKSYTVLTEKHLRDEKYSSKNSSFYIEDLSADDEVYTLQCPENYIRQNLLNQTFDFGKVNKIVDAKTNEVLQLSVLSIENKSLTVAMPRKGKTGVLIKLPLRGHILIKKIVKTPYHHHEITNEDSYSSGTDDNLLKELKSRHPLLGINWQAHIDLSDEAFKRQNKRIKREMKKKLKQKKTENCKREKKSEAESLHIKKKRKIDLR